MKRSDSRERERRRVRPPCYQLWVNMRRWCGYGGAKPEIRNRYYEGVAVCGEWAASYPAFEAWCMANGWRKGLHLARRDKDGDYCPENCVFVTQEVANGMRRCVRRLEDGRSVRDIIGMEGLSHDRERHDRIAKRIFEENWDVESAVAVPKMTFRECRFSGHPCEAKAVKRFGNRQEEKEK